MNINICGDALKVNWRDVFKFLAGYAAASFLANLYLYSNDISAPFLGYALSPETVGIRAIANLILFVVFFYFGFVRKW